ERARADRHGQVRFLTRRLQPRDERVTPPLCADDDHVGLWGATERVVGDELEAAGAPHRSRRVADGEELESGIAARGAGVLEHFPGTGEVDDRRTLRDRHADPDRAGRGRLQPRRWRGPGRVWPLEGPSGPHREESERRGPGEEFSPFHWLAAPSPR